MKYYDDCFLVKQIWTPYTNVGAVICNNSFLYVLERKRTISRNRNVVRPRKLTNFFGVVINVHISGVYWAFDCSTIHRGFHHNLWNFREAM